MSTTTRTDLAPTTAARYLEPDWITRQVINRLVRRLTRLGLSIRGSRELRVRGRVTGEWRSTPVNLLTVDGQDYLVAPRGVTQWVRNIRAAGGGELRLGRRVEAFRAVEVADADKAAVLRPYLRLWKAETGVFFDGLDAGSSDDELVAAGPKHPVFRLLAAG
jgi:deazaflavin-dependent oxidoreductase (nitroreductase family)